jgi:predicted DNA binding CopG/RHH family protein
MKKTIPNFRTDQEAERFVDTANLAEYDLSGGIPVRFEFEKKAARVNMRLPEPLLEAVKKRAKARGIPYQRFIREALESAVTSQKRGRRPPRGKLGRDER